MAPEIVMENGEKEICYRVSISYREPSYEMRVGPKEKAFHWRYEVKASDEQSAIDSALEEFKQMARMSRSGWVREVTEVTAERVESDKDEG